MVRPEGVCDRPDRVEAPVSRLVKVSGEKCVWVTVVFPVEGIGPQTPGRGRSGRREVAGEKVRPTGVGYDKEW